MDVEVDMPSQWTHKNGQVIQDGLKLAADAKVNKRTIDGACSMFPRRALPPGFGSAGDVELPNGRRASKQRGAARDGR